jgi:hypothetical protein
MDAGVAGLTLSLDQAQAPYRRDRRASNMCARELKTLDLIRREKVGALAPGGWDAQRGWAAMRTTSASEPVHGSNGGCMRQNEPLRDAPRAHAYH